MTTPFKYGIKNKYRPSQLAPKSYGWTRGASYSSADVPSQWVDAPANVTPEGLRQQFAYEWFQSGDHFAGFTGERGLTNPPFISGAAGRLHPLLTESTGKPARILRGYIRRAEYDVKDEMSKCRLYFMFNPEIITRDYVSYLEQSALDPFNTVYQSGNLIAPPSIMNFSFELFFDRQEESAGDKDHPGVFVDYQYFDMVVRNVIPTDPNQSNSTLPDNGVMMVNPRDITVVFSPHITVQGRPTNAQVVFEKFTHRMTPIRMRIQLTVLASYFGPVKDMIEYKKEELPSEEAIPFDKVQGTVYDISYTDVEDDSSGGDGDETGSGGGNNNVDYRGQLGQANDANHRIRLDALDWAMANVVQGGPGKGAWEGGGNWTDYTGRNAAAGRYALPRGADCSGLVTEAYCRIGHGNTMGWSGHPGTGSIMSTIKHNACVYKRLSEVGMSNLMPGDILIRNGHVAFLIKVEGNSTVCWEAATDKNYPEVGQRTRTGWGNFTHLIRPTPLGSTSSASTAQRWNS